MHQTDELRKKIEASEMIDKTMLHVETLGSTLWRANLRNYHKEANYQAFVKSFSQKKPPNSEKYIRQQAQKQQQILEQKESSKTFLILQNLASCADISSIYLDKSFKPTEIIRTPNFELAKQVQESILFNSYSDGLTTDHIDQSLKKENPTSNKGNWWYDTFKHSMIKEEEEEKSLENDVHKDSVVDAERTTSMMKTQPNFANISNFGKLSKSQMRMTYQSNFSSQSQVSRKKVMAIEALDKTLSVVKATHSHLISPTSDEDVAFLCVQGQNKLKMEVEAAKKIASPKVLLTRDAFLNEDNAQELRERNDKVLAMNYDIKLFY